MLAAVLTIMVLILGGSGLYHFVCRASDDDGLEFIGALVEGGTTIIAIAVIGFILLVSIVMGPIGFIFFPLALGGLIFFAQEM